MNATRLFVVPSLWHAALAPAFALALGLVASVSSSVAQAQNAEWGVKGDLTGKKGKASEDVSGLACATANGFPRTCLLIDDELQAAQVVTVTEGTITPGRMIKLNDDKFENKALELDGEGVAFDGEYFYVIGSHGRPRHEEDASDRAREAARVKARFDASSQLFRIRFNAATGTISDKAEPSRALAKLIAAEPKLAPFKDKALEDGGVTIEGIAVHNKRIYAGFRGPVFGARTVIMSAALGHFFDGNPAEATLHELDLAGSRGVRDLAAFGKGILVLSGPVQSVDGTYSVFWWDGSGTSVKLLGDLPNYKSDKGKQLKPEALLPLDDDGKTLRVLVLLDSAKNGRPRTVRLPYP